VGVGGIFHWVKAATHLQVVPRFRIGGAIYSLTLDLCSVYSYDLLLGINSIFQCSEVALVVSIVNKVICLQTLCIQNCSIHKYEMFGSHQCGRI
jgi:hypothetical protein